MTAGGVATNYLIDGQSVVREIQGENTTTYLPGPRGIEYRRNDTTGDVRWYLYDGLGNVVSELSEVISYEGDPPTPCATVTVTREYDVYGAVRGGSGTGTTDHKFVGSLGHTTDDTGLIYMRARYYDPAIGRFISEDPAYNDINWYIYAYNNLIRTVDKTGCEGTYIEEIEAMSVEEGMQVAGNTSGGAAMQIQLRSAAQLMGKIQNQKVINFLLNKGQKLSQWRYWKIEVEYMENGSLRYGAMKAMLRHVGNIVDGIVDAYLVENITSHTTPYIH